MLKQVRRISDHLTRLRHQTGGSIRIGDRNYRIKAYFPNDFAYRPGYETHLLAPLQRALEARPGPFIDVGVNLGQTLAKVVALAPGRPYLGFEPQIAACFFVSEFLRRNDLPNASVLPFGLSDQDGLIAFYSDCPTDPMGSTEQSETRPNLRRHVVQVRAGDAVLREAGFAEPGIIKIDVEGAELKVLRGLAGTLRAARPILFFEMLPNFSGAPGSGPAERWRLSEPERARRTALAEEQFGFLTDLGYDLFQIDGHGAEHRIERFELDDLNNAASDYVAYPRSTGTT